MKKIISFLIVVLLLFVSRNIYASNKTEKKGFYVSNEFKCECECNTDLYTSTNKGSLSGWYGLYSYYDVNEDELYFMELSWVYSSPNSKYDIKYISQDINTSFEHDNKSIADYAYNNINLYSFSPVVENGSYATSNSIAFEIGNKGIGISFGKGTTMSNSYRKLTTYSTNRYCNTHIGYNFEKVTDLSKSQNVLLAYKILSIPGASLCDDLKINVEFKYGTSFGIAGATSLQANCGFVYNYVPVEQSGGGKNREINPVNPNPYIADGEGKQSD